MGSEIARTYAIRLILDSVLGDQDRKMETAGPNQRLPETFRPVGDESRWAHVRTGRIDASPEKLLPGAKIESHGFTRVVVQRQEILRAHRLGHRFTAQRKPQATIMDRHRDQIVVDT